MWIDTHCHPFSKAFDEDREAVIQRALDAGVAQMIVVGYSQEGNESVLDLIEKYDFMKGALGVHPCDCNELTDEHLEWIRKKLRSNKKIVAIGEMGLDYHHMSFPKDVQWDCFRKQIRLAKELDLPCIVHSRDAAEDTLRILLEEEATKVIFHCYSYGLEFGEKVWAAGYYTSFSGLVTYPQAKDVHEAAKHAPIDKILIETDCPYLAPQFMRGKRNEMAYVVDIGEKIADLRNVSKEKLAEQLKKNVSAAFKF